MTHFNPTINFSNSFKIRLGHKELPFTDLKLLSEIIFSQYNTEATNDSTNIKRFMGFVEEDCHVHLFIEFRNKNCDSKSCEAIRKMLYKEIKYLENTGQGGQNPISCTPYKKYRKQEYKILSDQDQLYHQINYITKDYKKVLKDKFIKYNITDEEIDKSQIEYYTQYRNIINYFEKLKTNKKIKNKTSKQQFIDYIEANVDKMQVKNIPRIVAEYYIQYPQEHTPHNIKMKVYYVLSKYFESEYKQLVIQQLNQELIYLNLK